MTWILSAVAESDWIRCRWVAFEFMVDLVVLLEGQIGSTAKLQTFSNSASSLRHREGGNEGGRLSPAWRRGG